MADKNPNRIIGKLAPSVKATIGKRVRNADPLLQRAKPSPSQRYIDALKKEIDEWYRGADFNNPDYDDTMNYADMNEVWLNNYGDQLGMDGVYDVHDKYLTDRGVDLNNVKWDMPAHKIRALFKK